MPMMLAVIGWSTKYPNTATEPDFVRRLSADRHGLEQGLRGQLDAAETVLARHPETRRPQMTTLTNDIHIRAPRQKVWDILTQLDLLSTYDPRTKASVLTSELADGVGAERRCEVRPGGWFIERVVAWKPVQTLAFELVTCSLPVNSLRHDYTLSESNGLTHIIQVMTYELKYKAVGHALDGLVLRRKWDAGIKAFLGGLKEHVETLERLRAGTGGVQ